MLQTRADIEAGEKVLVLGASGGVGHAAVQIADHAGCEVFATASTEEKLSHAEECGADHVIDYETNDFADEDRRADRSARRRCRRRPHRRSHLPRLAEVDGEGRSARHLRRDHRSESRRRAQPDLLEPAVRNRVDDGDPGEVDDVLELVWDGTFEPHIRDTLPMSEAARAHEMIENREGFGKVVVKPDSEL